LGDNSGGAGRGVGLAGDPEIREAGCEKFRHGLHEFSQIEFFLIGEIRVSKNDGQIILPNSILKICLPIHLPVGTTPVRIRILAKAMACESESIATL
jgi:hypothetical protein